MSAVSKINPEKIFSKIFEKNQNLFVFYRIAQRWENLVKKVFIKNTYPLKLSKNKILFVAIRNSAIGSQFYYSKEDVISKINTYLGYEVITDIKITLRPSDKRMS